jgi:PTH1 family peptidyl-tRNA hydrolase
MKIILGQGNPGAEYTATRHNIGWILLDALAGDAAFQPRSKFSASVAEIIIDGEKALLIKPTTFYNETGRTARALLDFYKLTPSDLLVIHDDLALPLGTVRIRGKGSDAGNNGIKSLNAHVGQEFWRMRIGIWNELHERQHDADFVLSRFSVEEHAFVVEHLTPEVKKLVRQFCASNISHTSAVISFANKKPA